MSLNGQDSHRANTHNLPGKRAPSLTAKSTALKARGFHPLCWSLGTATWDGLGWVARAGGDDVEDFRGPGCADAEVGLLRDHLGQRLVGSGPLLWRLFLDGWKIKEIKMGES